MDISFYQQHFKLFEYSFERIDHNDALVAIVYKLQAPNHPTLILKICTRKKDFRRETYFLQFFANKLPVARIIQVVEPTDETSGAVLMNCIPGELLKAINLSKELAYEIGSLLASIHENRIERYGDITQPEMMVEDPIAYFNSQFENNFSECRNNLPKQLLDDCRHYYEANLHFIRSADGPCITHGDFRPGNLIVEKQRVTGIIDWASAKIGFAQQDLCSWLHGEWLFQKQVKDAFFSGYASVRPVPEYKAVMPLLEVNKSLATIGFLVKQNTWSNLQTALYRFNRSFLEQFFHKG